MRIGGAAMGFPGKRGVNVIGCFVVMALVVGACSSESIPSRVEQETKVLTLDSAVYIPETFVGSPNGRCAGYAAKIGEERYVIVDGAESSRYAKISAPVFSSDSLRVAFTAQRADDLRLRGRWPRERRTRCLRSLSQRV